MELTQEQIEKINLQCSSSEQGIYKEPYGIPNHIKALVIYMCWETGGVSGGSCWDYSNPQPYTVDREDEPKFEVLDLVLNELKPDLKYNHFKGVEKLIHSTTDSDWEYYGNCTDYEIKYIILDDLINFLKNL